jgi:hypothetical protein
MVRRVDNIGAEALNPKRERIRREDTKHNRSRHD